jgi:hypothetical protein
MCSMYMPVIQMFFCRLRVRKREGNPCCSVDYVKERDFYSVHQMLGREGEYSNAVVWTICQEETGIHVYMYLIADFGPGREGGFT